MPYTRQLDVPDWGTAVVLAGARGRGFPVLVTGEPAGRRIACLGATLHPPIASSDQLGVLLLTLGALHWLDEPASPAPLLLNTGRPLATGLPGDAMPTAPGLTTAGDPAVVVADRRGVHRLTTRAGERLIIANLFDERESIGIPAGVSYEEAASIPLVFLVVHDMLVLQGRLQPGEWVTLRLASVRPIAIEEATRLAPLSKIVLRQDNRPIGIGRCLRIVR